MTRDCQRLLVMLGITSATKRHFSIIKDHIESGAIDPKALLNKLGEWEEKDLHTVETWYKTL